MEFNNNKGEYLFPYDIKWVDEDTNKEMMEKFTGQCKTVFESRAFH